MPFQSFQSRVLMLVLAAGLIPLAVVGWWITGSAARAGEEMIAHQLDVTLQEIEESLIRQWTLSQVWMREFMDSDDARATLRQSDSVPEKWHLPETAEFVDRLCLRDPEGRDLGCITRPGVIGDQGLTRVFEVFSPDSQQPVGSVQMTMNVVDVIQESHRPTTSVTPLVSAFDRDSNRPLTAVPIGLDASETNRFEWAQEEWMSVRRDLFDPPVLLVAYAPLTSVTGPFREASREGLRYLIVVVAFSILIAILLTRRMTRSLERLSTAASEIARGNLEAQLSLDGSREISRVAQAFNSMADSLRKTLRQLADRQALSAVGEYAATLSHEVRNALTAIRLDLQVAGELLPDHPAVTAPHSRALRELDRLNDTVTGSLELARSGNMKLEPVDLLDPVRGAIHGAGPELKERRVHLERVLPQSPVFVRGDTAAIEQLLLNILLNAAQASSEGDSIELRVAVERGEACISIRDEGAGIPADQMERLFEPFYSTKPNGTGLGLPIARRIAQVLGGALSLHSIVGEGTSVLIRLPIWPGDTPL